MNDEKIKQEIANAWNQESNFYDSHVSHGMKSDEEKKLWMEAFSTRVKNDTQLYNPLYELGLDRIGCFMCPSSDIACMKDIEARYPELWADWERKLKAWGDANGKSPEWAAKGLWRIRETNEEDSDIDGHF